MLHKCIQIGKIQWPLLTLTNKVSPKGELYQIATLDTNATKTEKIHWPLLTLTYNIIPKRHSRSTMTGATLKKMDTACLSCRLLKGSRQNTARLDKVVI